MKNCDNCGIRPVEAGTYWDGSGCSLCAARRGYQNLPQWCDRCMLEAKLEHDRAAAARIPELEAKLNALVDG
jgi:hypothetical protein